MHGQHSTPPIDQLIGTLAGRQHGVLARRQLLAVGLTSDQIDRRLALGRLIVLYRGVYALGHRPLTREGEWMAAVLACGEGAVLSYRSAAAHWGLIRRCPPFIDVTVRHGKPSSRGRLIVHRSPQLANQDIRTKLGIPITSPARTLLDYAEVATRRELERALDETERLRLCSQRQITAVIARCFGRQGGSRLKAVLHDHAAGTTATVNDFEELFLALCESHGIPRPEVNAKLGRYRPDFLWREHKLIVETDGRQTHGTRRAFEDDRARDAELRTSGYRVLRFTWRQLTRDPDWVARKLRAALAAG